MNYLKEKIQDNINLHVLKTDKFKTNLLAVYITTAISKNTVTKNALIPAVLRRGSSLMPSSDEISKSMEEMYGASFDCGIDKIGDNQVLKFYAEGINNDFLPTDEDLFKKLLHSLLDIVFNPVLVNGKFKDEYVDGEKENLKQIIEGKIDNKGQYAFTRCIEEMYNGKPYALYKYGYIEDLDEIDSEKLYNQYINLINTAKIDIFVSGNIDDSICNIVKNDENILKLTSRDVSFILKGESADINSEIKEIQDKMDITQGKLVIGLNINLDSKESKYVAAVYNAILGGTPTSKLFQNVREKASLAYTASSNYMRHKNNIFIRCGIEIDNYEKAVSLIKEQLEEIKQGNFNDEDIKSSKNNIIAAIKSIPDEQDTEISYYFGQELSDIPMSFDEYENNINSVTKEDIVEFAKSVSINTIYFLRN